MFVPPEAVSTEKARGLLPRQCPHADAAANAGRAALLVRALTGAPQLLLAATEDRLHQSYRASAMPESYELMTSLRERWHRSHDLGRRADGSGLRARTSVTGFPSGWTLHELDVDPEGAHVVVT